MKILNYSHRTHCFQEGGDKAKAGLDPALFCEGYVVNLSLLT